MAKTWGLNRKDCRKTTSQVQLTEWNCSFKTSSLCYMLYISYYIVVVQLFFLSSAPISAVGYSCCFMEMSDHLRFYLSQICICLSINPEPSYYSVFFLFQISMMTSSPCYWPFVQGIHRSPVNSPHKGQWRGALMFSLICARINGWVNSGEAGGLRHQRAHYDLVVMQPEIWWMVQNITRQLYETHHIGQVLYIQHFLRNFPW